MGRFRYSRIGQNIIAFPKNRHRFAYDCYKRDKNSEPVYDKSNDISHSVCTFDEFAEMMKNGEIRWNELYFVQQ
ncbi:MAG: hypothetical protein MJ100_10100 [Ruminococcus sp.]|nr:hypothetical protein [Ruminococcus sp.]